jgi:nucleotide-binding universal stress UspA family protein
MGTATEKALANKMIQLARILVAIDFSPVSMRALDYAESLARRYDSHVYLAHVISMEAYPLAAPEVSVGLANTQRQKAENKIQEMLFAGRLRDLPYEVLIKEGALWPTLDRIILKNEIDLVVVGTHGMGAVHKLVIGSGAEQIFRQSTRPVLTVKHILFATDFGLGAEREAAYAFSLGQEHEATVTLLHVLRHLEDHSESGIALKRAAIRHRLQDLVPSGGDDWCQTQLRTAIGDPAEEILRTAEDTQADLIVMGAKARAGFAGHVPGTKAYKIVSQAHCPVLTIRS